MALFRSSLFSDDMSFLGKIRQIAWGQIFFLCIVATIGFLSLYSAAGGHIDPWASPQIIRFAFSLGVLLAIGMTDIRWIFRIAYPFHILVIILLLLVDIFGHIGMGAQRWLDLGVMKIQPSELAKISTILCLARYYHGKELYEARQFKNLIPAVGMILVPVGLVVAQPDLGTGMAIVFGGTAMLFVAGVSIWLFLAGIGAAIAAVPIAWQFMHEYQQKRVQIFLNPESDPLGAGFHITQSKIALGSGGVLGKGYLEGTQSHLNFLPEKHTDFIFTLEVRNGDEVMREYGIAPTVIKIDTEGFEKFVLLGMKESLKSSRPSVIFEYSDITKGYLPNRASFDSVFPENYEIFGILRSREYPRLAPYHPDKKFENLLAIPREKLPHLG